MSAEALKPCPFCGTQPTIEQTGFSGRARYIYCNLDDCLRPKAVGENEEAAIRSWNTRTPTPADGEAHAEIQRLQDAKRRALAIADERAKENVALRAALAASEGVRAWHDGAPTKPWSGEWFIAETTYGDCVVLIELPEEWTYDFKTADETYIKKDKIKRWMQFPDSQYIPPTSPEPDEGPDPLGYAKGER